MRVRIEAQHHLDGRMQCELVITGPHDAEVHLPATLVDPDETGLLELLASGRPLAVEVDAPLLYSVQADVSRAVQS